MNQLNGTTLKLAPRRKIKHQSILTFLMKIDKLLEYFFGKVKTLEEALTHPVSTIPLVYHFQITPSNNLKRHHIIISSKRIQEHYLDNQIRYQIGL